MKRKCANKRVGKWINYEEKMVKQKSQQNAECTNSEK